MNNAIFTQNADSALYPKCNNGLPPRETDGSRDAERKRVFLQAYYNINQCYKRLLSIRAQGGSRSEEREALQAIEGALLARDSVEDRYAPFGVIATPEYENGYVKNVHFSHPRALSAQTMIFAVPTARV